MNYHMIESMNALDTSTVHRNRWREIQDTEQLRSASRLAAWEMDRAMVHATLAVAAAISDAFQLADRAEADEAAAAASEQLLGYLPAPSAADQALDDHPFGPPAGPQQAGYFDVAAGADPLAIPPNQIGGPKHA